jgi:hypothetical protein
MQAHNTSHDVKQKLCARETEFMNAPCVGASIERSARADPSSVGSAHKADRKTSRIGKLLPGVARDGCRTVTGRARNAHSRWRVWWVGGTCSGWVRGHWSREVGTGRDAHLREGFQAVGLWCGCGVQLACGDQHVFVLQVSASQTVGLCKCKWCVFIICRYIATCIV